jgi:hypothetical protein
MQRSSIASLVLVAGAGACRKRQPAQTQASAAVPATVPTVGPNGTAPAPADNPAQAVQITGTNAGQSSIRSVPPTPATGCPAQQPNAALGPGTVHNHEITQNETWTLEGSPHRFPDGINIQSGATVTIAPCAVVLVGHDQGFHVHDGGALMAIGDAQHPIRIGSDNPNPQPGDWWGLEITEHARVTSRLAHTIIEHAGGGGGAIESCLRVALNGFDVQNVTLQNCRAFGASVDDTGAFSATSSNLRVTGTVAGDAAHSGAVQFSHPNAVRTLPSGTYTGNVINEIYVTGGGADHPIRTTGTWQNPGVPYHIADNIDLRVEGPTGPILTIAPGTTIKFGRDAGLVVGWDAEGGLVADGQSEQGRITFTTASSDPSPGAWDGLTLGERFNRSRSRLDFVTISYGGGHDAGGACAWGDHASGRALLHIHAVPQPQLLGHVRFVGVPDDGAALARNWNGAAVNFAAASLGNDFGQLGAACHQTPVRNAQGSCGEPRACD